MNYCVNKVKIVYESFYKLTNVNVKSIPIITQCMGSESPRSISSTEFMLRIFPNSKS